MSQVVRNIIEPRFSIRKIWVVNHDSDFGSSRSQKAWLLLRVFYTDFEHFFVPRNQSRHGAGKTTLFPSRPRKN
jgi:hypothetical protein